MNEGGRILGYAIQQQRSAEETYDEEDVLRACHAAFELAMCGEFALKAYLLLNSFEPPGTHKHEVLIRECGRCGLKIPRYLRDVMDILYEFESSTRYDADYFVEDTEFKEACNALARFIDILLNTCASGLIKKLRETLSADQTADISDALLLQKYFIYLE